WDRHAGHPGHERDDGDIARVQEGGLIAARPVPENARVRELELSHFRFEPRLLHTAPDEQEEDVLVTSELLHRVDETFQAVRIPHVAGILHHELVDQSKLTSSAF